MSLRKKLVLVFAIIVSGVIALSVFFSRQYVVPIIMYHSVGTHPRPGNACELSINTFERQMQFLKKHHYNVVPLTEVVRIIKNKQRFPPRTIAITLDDGYADNYYCVFPILKKYGFPATEFIIINEVGRPENDKLNWKQIKEMQDSGIFTIGSHTLGPDPLIKIKDEEKLKSEIFASKKIIEDMLGRKVEFFSYPEGMFNAKIKQLVIDAGYSAAVATHPGISSSKDDLFALKRLRISENSSNMFIFGVETSGFYTFMQEYKKRHGKK